MEKKMGQSRSPVLTTNSKTTNPEWSQICCNQSEKTITNKQNEIIKLILIGQKILVIRIQISKLVVGSGEQDICQQIHLGYPQK